MSTAKKPRRAKRARRTQKDAPEIQGVSSAQKVLAALLDKHDPPTTPKSK